MFSLIKRLLTILFGKSKQPTKDAQEQSTNRQVVSSLVGEIDPYKLFDCVMLEDRYLQMQQLIREEIDPEFDPFLDLGIVLGSSMQENNNGVPSYYIVGWFNHSNPEKPILKQYEHFNLVPVIRPLADLTERSKQLNTMFQAFFTNWLDMFNHENATKN